MSDAVLYELVALSLQLHHGELIMRECTHGDECKRHEIVSVNSLHHYWLQ